VPDLHTLLVFTAASAVLIAVPGPSVLYIVTRSVAQGRRAGVVSMLGIEAGAVVHVVAAAIGLSALIASSATAFTILKYAGAAYLIFLGLRKLAERPSPAEEADAVPGRTGGRLFWEGALVNALNPKVATFFVAFLPQFIDPERGSTALQALLLGVLFIAVAVVCDTVWAVLAGTASGRLRSATGGRVMSRVSGSVYVSLGAAAALAEGRPPRR